jgi:hypothetical protein
VYNAHYVHLLQPDGHSASWLDAWLRPDAAASTSSSSGSSASHKTFRKGSPRGARHNTNGSGSSSASATASVPMADIYAIGLQEMVDLNAVNVAVDKKSQSRSAKVTLLFQLIELVYFK